MGEKMVRFDVDNETGDSHMVTMVTEDMYAVMNLMNDYNLSWEAVYNIILENIEIDYERLVYEDSEILNTRSFLERKEWKQYRKKPVVIRAYQTDRELKISTLEGDMIANKGDYVIEGVKRELYPCKPEVFKETYEEVQKE